MRSMQVTNPDNKLYVVLSSGLSTDVSFEAITHIGQFAGRAIIYTQAATYHTRYRLKDIYSVLPHHQFFRISRNHIVAIDSISRIYKNRAVVNANYLLISSEYRFAFYSAIEKLVNSEYMFYKLDVA